MFIILNYKRCLLLLTIWAVCSSLVWGAIPAQERSALIAFYNAANGITWADNWKTPPLDTDGFSLPGTEGSWYGITVEDDHVAEIVLNNGNITGVIPPEIGTLGFLKKFWLLNTELTGGIPPEIGNLANLEELFLASSLLGGNIPTEIGNLTNLRTLRLEGDSLTGNIPASLGNLVKLNFFALDANELSGSIPPELGNLHNLGVLDFQANHLSGSIPPELGNLVNLYYLTLYSNQLSGNIPPELGNLQNLGVLGFEKNQLSGNIPSSLGNLVNLTNLNLSNNQLSGNIPAELGNLHIVKRLYLQQNRLSGEIPGNLMNLTAVSDLDIGYNCLYALDPTLRIWLNVHDPDWEDHQNQCDGVPPAIILTSPHGGETFTVGSSHSITWSTVNMTGDVKIEYSTDNGSTWAEIIAAAPNTGSYAWTVPDTASSQCLVKISKADSGSPSDISDDTFSIITGSTTSITVVYPNGGETLVVGLSYPITWTFTGTIENVKIEYTRDNGSSWTEIIAAAPNTGSYTWTIPNIAGSQCKIKISAADSGAPSDRSDGPFFIVATTIPAQERAALIAFYNSTNGDGWTKNSGWKTPPLYTDGFAMPGTEARWHGITAAGDHVTKIEMYENNLTGSIAPEIGNLSQLQVLYLNSNSIGGSIPPALGNLANLRYLYLSQNVMVGNVPTGLTNLPNLIYLELSNNRLSGNINPEIGNMVKLEVLQLDGNQFSGSIPAALGKLINLGRLYLNANRLSGSIPPEMGNLISLGDLDLAGNPLTGTFPPEMGNLRNLVILYISSTQISGSIPSEFGNMVNLKQIFLHKNQLSGGIPAEWGNFHNLVSLFLNNNKLSGEIPPSLTNLNNIQDVDIGYNCLEATDAAVRAWLNIYDPDWEAHQDQCDGQLPTITVTSPNGGESWTVNSSHYIRWISTGTIENVKIEYTADGGANWATITSAAPNTGFYNWTVPDIISSRCIIKISEASTGTPADTGNAMFSIISRPTIHINPNKLNFSAKKNGAVTDPQEIRIVNKGGGTLNWSISSDASWLTVSPVTGTGDGIITVSVNPGGLDEGTYSGSITVSDPNADNSPQTISVTLKVKIDSPDMAPFGEFSTPADGAVVSGSIPVTGWALDETGVKGVKIYREEADGQSLVFIGDAIFVEGARPDVETLYPDYPNNYKAGWGYMLLTNFFPDEGNGVFKLHAVVEDVDGHTVTLGIKTITVDNANAEKPYGAIDTPAQGGAASGRYYINWGWVLAAQTNNIPTDGSTIAVWIDGKKIGRPVYNNYREDIAALFPGYANSNGAVGYYYLDTTKYKDGIHTIQWTAADNVGNADGIGSRYFTIQNTASGEKGSEEEQKSGRAEKNNSRRGEPPCSPVFDPCSPAFDETETVEIKELERVEIKIKSENIPSHHITGYLAVGDKLRNLPIGSTLDSDAGIFYWQPGVGFLGEYHLVFMEQEETGRSIRKDIVISITPKVN